MNVGAGATLVVLAKSPLPGRVKTRLSPPCSARQASGLARAALQDTLDAALATDRFSRRVLAIGGPVGEWLPPGFDVIEQRGNGLGERMAAVFDVLEGAVLMVGMDTPQLTPAALDRAVARLHGPGADAVLGPALDGGYWAIGMLRPDPRAFDGVAMSRSDTCHQQRLRLQQLGLLTTMLEQLRDVDTFEDAAAVAEQAPGTRFAAGVRELAPELIALR